MPLPEKVIEQLGREPPRTPGWSFGVIMFSGVILFIVVFIYLGLTLGYEPYLDKQVQQNQDEITQLSQSIKADDQANLINFYSQVTNLKTLLKNHSLSSQFFTWLEKNTEANVFYTAFTLSGGNQIAITGSAPTEGDVNQQIAIFESSPEVQKANITNVTAAPSGAGWIFNVTITVAPSIFLRQS